MMNRISNRLIARFVAVAALLALVMAAPAVFAQENIDYPENGTESCGSNFDARRTRTKTPIELVVERAGFARAVRDL